MDRMKKIKRQLSMTLRGGRAPEKSLGEPRDGHGSDSEAGADEGRMGSDGESDPPSGTSSEEVASPVRLRLRQHPPRPGSSEDINKRLSLPADTRLPEGGLDRLGLPGPLSRRLRRVSLSEIGFGKLETYVKLDKLGEMSQMSPCPQMSPMSPGCPHSPQCPQCPLNVPNVPVSPDVPDVPNVPMSL